MEYELVKKKILEGAEYEDYFNHQKEIMEIVRQTKNNILLQAPTSSGKTLSITPYIYDEFLNQSSLIYAVPSKAMVNDKIQEFKKYFSNFDDKPIINKVGMDDSFRNGDIVIGTFEEIYAAALHQNILNSFDDIVFDDFHVLYGEGRGYTIEKLITFILTTEKIRMIALSATISPLSLLSKWLDNAKVIKYGEETRPVQIKKKVLQISNELDLLKKREEFPALVFCTTKSYTVNRCKKIKEFRKKNGYERKSIISEVLNNIKMEDLDLIQKEIIECMEYGVAYHNSDLDARSKYWVESAMKKGDIDLLFATSTLAYGINLPIKTVFIYDIHRWWERDNLLPKYEWEQMAGRAGRTGMQNVGMVYTCYKGKKKDYDSIITKYHFGSVENVESSINHDDCFKKAILDIISIGDGSETLILNFFENSLFNAYSSKAIFGPKYDLKSAIDNQIVQLYKMGFIERRSHTGFVLTEFGKEVVNFLFSTFEDYQLKALWSLNQQLKNVEEITVKEIVELSIKIVGFPLTLKANKTERTRIKVNTEEEATLKVLFDGWLNNIGINEIFSRFGGKWAMHIRDVSDKISNFVMFAYKLAAINGVSVQGDIYTFCDMIKSGLSGNLLGLKKAKYVGRKRALMINDYLLTTDVMINDNNFSKLYEKNALNALSTLSDDHLKNLFTKGNVRTIGDVIGNSIIDEVRKD